MLHNTDSKKKEKERHCIQLGCYHHFWSFLWDLPPSPNNKNHETFKVELKTEKVVLSLSISILFGCHVK